MSVDDRLRTKARLRAVQLLYQADLNKEGFESVLDGSFDDDSYCITLKENNKDHYILLVTNIVQGVGLNNSRIDELVNSYLDGEKDIYKLEYVMRSLLRAATCELLINTTVPFKVVLNEYINLTHIFFNEKGESNLVNGVLDKIARELRPEEM